MSLETDRQSAPDASAQPSLFKKPLHALEQYKRDAARSFAATVLAAAFILATPSSASSISQVDTTPKADINPTTIAWGPGLETADGGKVLGAFAIVGLVLLGIVAASDRHD